MNFSAITYKRESITDYSKTYDKEWLITNNLGGYASSTIIGVNTRGYHGLLVASLPPNIRRVLLLSKLEEEVIIDGKKHSLSTNRYPDTLYPDGNQHLEEFRLDPLPNYIYRIGENIIKKTIFMPPGHNTTIISYKFKTLNSVEVNIRPLVNYRDFHSRTRENSGLTFIQYPISGGTRLEPSTGQQAIFLRSNNGEYEPAETWYRNMVYDLETDRGLVDREDHFSPGIFKATLKDQDVFIIVASIESSASPNEAALDKTWKTRASSSSHLNDWLIHAANQFIVKLPDSTSTIIAGYHWFGEWGRDSAIALPGLLLTTRRFKEAKQILRRYLNNTRNGLVPVYFDENMKPHYTSIDTSLWLIYATYKYFTYTSDIQFVKEVYPKLIEIITWYQRGTDYSRITEDNLLETKSEQYSLTWMDARIDGVSATPRRGKCVEVNALWYNALKTVEDLSNRLGEDAEPYAELGSNVQSSFNQAFWNDSCDYLYDYIDREGGDDSLRPNQILSISLPFPVLHRQKWGSVFKKIEEYLATPYGLRTLSPKNPSYRGACTGNPRERDLAYHNGTVWAWLAGPFITSYVKLGGRPCSPMINDMLQAFEGHLYEAGLGNVSEIFDGDAPHRPRGCISQAWSIGELLRTISEDLGGLKKESNR